MGRGGPAEPELVETPPSLDDLVALSRSGRHAASDHLETAVLAGVPTIGCRRAGGGLAGAPFTSNVLEGAELAVGLDPDVVVFDGSGAAIPPVATDARILVAHDAASGLNPYRVLISDLVLTMSDEVARDVHALGGPCCASDCACGRRAGRGRPGRGLHDGARRPSSISTRTSSSRRAISPIAPRSREDLARRRRRHVRRRDQGGSDRRRRRGARSLAERASCLPTTRSFAEGLDDAILSLVPAVVRA